MQPHFSHPPAKSTRRLTQDTGAFTRETAGSQSLDRGLHILRTFHIGTSTLTNAQLAERTHLPRPTVSRLTRTLVDNGFLSYDMANRAYRLSAVFLSLADSFRSATPILDKALPLMEKLARKEGVNVGLAVPDRLSMTYLASLRLSPDGVSRTRKVTSGSRVPIELTSIGRAYLAAMPKAWRDATLKELAQRYGRKWPALKKELAQAMNQYDQHGYCNAEWLQNLMGVGATLVGPDDMLYAVNLSFEVNSKNDEQRVRHYASMLLQLVATIKDA
jgi:DNA-binding IclR family transcriptional regulator